MRKNAGYRRLAYSLALVATLAGCDTEGGSSPDAAVSLQDATYADAVVPSTDAQLEQPDGAVEPVVACEAVAREWCALHAQCGPFLPGDFPACVAEMSALCPGDTDDAPCLADLDVQWPDGPIECDEFAPVLPESCTWLVTP